MPVYNYLLHFNYLPMLHLLKQNQEQKKGNFLVSCSPSKVNKGELFSVVQSRSSLELRWDRLEGQDTHLITNNPIKHNARTPTSFRTIQVSNHLTSVVTIDRPTCDQLMQPPEKLGTCTSPPLAIYLNSKNKKLHQTHYVDQNFQYPHPPKEKRKIHKNFNKRENTKLAL